MSSSQFWHCLKTCYYHWWNWRPLFTDTDDVTKNWFLKIFQFLVDLAMLDTLEWSQHEIVSWRKPVKYNFLSNIGHFIFSSGNKQGGDRRHFQTTFLLIINNVRYWSAWDIMWQRCLWLNNQKDLNYFKCPYSVLSVTLKNDFVWMLLLRANKIVRAKKQDKDEVSRPTYIYFSCQQLYL